MRILIFVVCIILAFTLCKTKEQKVETIIEDGVEVVLNKIEPVKIKGEHSNLILIIADSSISINFIFLTKTEQHQLDMYRMNPSGLVLDDISAEIFGAFHEMAEATGGITDSSANIASSFQRAAIASENYYLLYYTPKNYKADGKFRKIEVKIKGKKYKVTHRAGYIAD